MGGGHKCVFQQTENSVRRMMSQEDIRQNVTDNEQKQSD